MKNSFAVGRIIFVFITFFQLLNAFGEEYNSSTFENLQNAEPKKLLSCSTESAIYRQVDVVKMGNVYYLQLLSPEGNWTQHTLPKSQWKNFKLQIPCDADSVETNCGMVELTAGGWFYRIGRYGFTQTGVCALE